MDGVACATAAGGTFEVPRLVLRPGDILVVHVPVREENLPPLCDLASGIQAVTRGSVRFMGDDWSDTGAFRQGAMRGRIGRVFQGSAWVSNLSMAENVLLPQRHHTGRSDQALLDEAGGLARTFDLPELPAARPEALRPHDLIRWQWVRAFLGNPRLLLFDEPGAMAWEEHLPALRQRTLRQADEGGAVLWVTHEEDVWREAGTRPVLHASAGDGKLSAVSEAK